MAFQPADNSAPTSRPARAGRGEFEKATGFLNIYAPTKGGGRRKVGAIPFNASNAVQKQLHDMLSADPEAVQAIMAKLVFEYQVSINDDAPENQLDI